MRGRVQTLVLAVLLLAGLGACAPRVDVQRLDSVQRPRNSGSLDVYQSADQVGRSYKRIALLKATSQKRVRKEKGSVETPLSRQAKDIGADALIVVERRPKTQRNSDGMGGYMEFVVEEITAEAIVYE